MEKGKNSSKVKSGKKFVFFFLGMENCMIIRPRKAIYMHTVVPNVVGGGLSVGAPRVEFLANWVKGSGAASSVDGGVLDIRLMMILIVLLISYAPKSGFLVVWVACGHCRCAHNVSPPFLSILVVGRSRGSGGRWSGLGIRFCFLAVGGRRRVHGWWWLWWWWWWRVSRRRRGWKVGVFNRFGFWVFAAHCYWLLELKLEVEFSNVWMMNEYREFQRFKNVYKGKWWAAWRRKCWPLNLTNERVLRLLNRVIQGRWRFLLFLSIGFNLLDVTLEVNTSFFSH